MDENTKNIFFAFLCFWVLMDILIGMIYYKSFLPCLSSFMSIMKKPKFLIIILMCAGIAGFIYKNI